MDANITNTLPDTFLVIHINAFTSKIESGYMRHGKKRISEMLTPAEIAAAITADTDLRIDALKV